MNTTDVIIAVIGVCGTILAILSYVIKRTIPSVAQLLKTIEEQHAYTAKLTSDFRASVDEGNKVNSELSNTIKKSNEIAEATKQVILSNQDRQEKMMEQLFEVIKVSHVGYKKKR